MDFLYHNVALPFAGFLIEMVPWWVWVLLAALALALGWRLAVAFWKLFGWQGVLALSVAVLTLGAFRQGWLAHKTATLTGVAKDDPLFDLSPKAPAAKKPTKKKRQTIFTPGAIPDFFKRIRGRD
jgi:hypothetical protein